MHLNVFQKAYRIYQGSRNWKGYGWHILQWWVELLFIQLHQNCSEIPFLSEKENSFSYRNYDQFRKKVT